MPFCPNCRYEYKPGVATCPDCGAELVDSLPEKSEEQGNEIRNSEDWVQLGRLTSQQYAEMIEEALKEKDIPVVVLSSVGHFGYTGQMGISSFRPVGGGYTVMVPKEYAADADEIAQIVIGDEWEKSRLPH
jgi:hypothetical protein